MHTENRAQNAHKKLNVQLVDGYARVGAATQQMLEKKGYLCVGVRFTLCILCKNAAVGYAAPSADS